MGEWVCGVVNLGFACGVILGYSLVLGVLVVYVLLNCDWIAGLCLVV